MAVYTDQLNRRIEIAEYPRRIVSVVPSQTELLYDLDLADEVTGITKFCIHPPSWFRHKSRVGGTKSLNIDKIKALQPDLILANKEENTQTDIETLATEFPVWISDINNLNEALAMIEQVGAITGRTEKAKSISLEISRRFNNYKIPDQIHKPTCAYLIWKDPYMAAGGDTFINSILDTAGYKNIFSDTPRYPETTSEELKSKHCDLLFLSSEPYPFKQKHIEELQDQLPGSKIPLVDGEMFSWYGSRLLYTPDYLTGLQQQIASIS